MEWENLFAFITGRGYNVEKMRILRGNVHLEGIFPRNYRVYGKDGFEMREDIKGFIEYLEKEKGASENTCVSYRRDLVQMTGFLEEMGIT